MHYKVHTKKLLLVYTIVDFILSEMKLGVIILITGDVWLSVTLQIWEYTQFTSRPITEIKLKF